MSIDLLVSIFAIPTSNFVPSPIKEYKPVSERTDNAHGIGASTTLKSVTLISVQIIQNYFDKRFLI